MMTTDGVVVSKTAPDNFLVLDYETTMNSKLPNAASPFDKKNHSVLVGNELPDVPNDIESQVIVAHNAAFDINWYRRDWTDLKLNYPKFDFWCTQLAEYLISGQTSRFPSLDECAKKYGGTLKDSRIHDEYFSKGLGAGHVPLPMLKEYLENDVKNTRLVFDGQLKELDKLGMMPLAISQMKALQATTEMQWNGMTLDVPFVQSLIKTGEDEVNALEGKLYIAAYEEDDKFPSELNLLSNVQLASWLYGLPISYKYKAKDGVYKSGAKMGTTKYKTVHGLYTPSMKLDPPVGSMTVDAKTLEGIRSKVSPKVLEVIDIILSIREKSKQLSTYFKAHLECVASDGRVHPQFNHCNTATGRLSSSAPNMQNVTSDGLIKRAYVSRWGDDGVIMEADYQQLEMVMLAHLSKDPVLIDDLNSGKDMHSELYNAMYGRYPTPEERKPFKRLSFGLVYGAGVNTLAENAGVDVAIARHFRKVFYERYKGVARYHIYVVNNAHRSRVSSSLKTKEGYPAGQYVQVSETGRRYVYTEYDAPEFMKAAGMHTSFSPTELKNYPVQGGATGDIVPLALGKLYELLKPHDQTALLINTVHDSVVLDVKKEHASTIALIVKTCLETAPEYYEETFGVPFNLKLNVNVTYGPTWLDQTEKL